MIGFDGRLPPEAGLHSRGSRPAVYLVLSERTDRARKSRQGRERRGRTKRVLGPLERGRRGAGGRTLARGTNAGSTDGRSESLDAPHGPADSERLWLAEWRSCGAASPLANPVSPERQVRAFQLFVLQLQSEQPPRMRRVLSDYLRVALPVPTTLERVERGPVAGSERATMRTNEKAGYPGSPAPQNWTQSDGSGSSPRTRASRRSSSARISIIPSNACLRTPIV